MRAIPPRLTMSMVLSEFRHEVETEAPGLLPVAHGHMTVEIGVPPPETALDAELRDR
ncbi:hypothetical protein RvVAT039_13300 [Agrobacterium vitis]|nr:hypothetical protein RvVAT039_13300 [Agrobacterium vitis]